MSNRARKDSKILKSLGRCVYASAARGKQGQVQLVATARRALRTNWTAYGQGTGTTPKSIRETKLQEVEFDAYFPHLSSCAAGCGGALLLLFAVTGAGQESDRYAPRDPLSLTLPRRAVTRRDYVEFLRPFAKDYQMTPQADQWGWRHGPLRLMPPLAVFAFDGDRELGQRVKADLRTFARWVDQCVATKGVVFCLDAATFCTLCAQELRQRDLLTADDETWIRDLLLKIRQYHPAWAEGGPWDGWFRGSHHRAGPRFQQRAGRVPVSARTRCGRVAEGRGRDLGRLVGFPRRGHQRHVVLPQQPG